MFGLEVNFGLSNSGGITVAPGASGSNTITATLTAGSTQSVSFSASGLPSGATAGFSFPGACSPTCSITLTIFTTSSTPTGTFPITVTGSPLSNTTTFNLVVNPPPLARAVGVFRPSSGWWFLDLNGNTQWDGCGVERCGNFGVPGSDIPVVGDWTGSGTTKIGIFRNGQWFLDLNGNAQFDGCGVELCGSFGLPGDIPVVGKW